MTVVNSSTPKAAAKHDLLFNKPSSGHLALHDTETFLFQSLGQGSIELNLSVSASFKPNEGILAASFCPQVAASVPDMFCNFYLVKNHKIANSSTTTVASKRMSAYLESIEFYDIFWCMFD
jgi:hypothetical protein